MSIPKMSNPPMFRSGWCGRRARRAGIRIIALVLAVASAAAAQEAAGPSPPFDVVIRNGRIVDGTGAPWYTADLGIRRGRVVAIGRLDGPAETEIDAAGLVVAPGFVDMMGQTANPLLDDARHARNLLTQGITTINAGEGASAAPLGPEEAKRSGWRTMSEYFQLLELEGLPINVVQTVGHTQVRRLVLGDVDRRPTPEELEQMRAHVREAMEAGAIGVSTALIYPPAVYASTEEIAELAKVAGEYGGRYFTHMRNEGDKLLEAIDESLEIGRAAGTPVHIFHLKAAGRDNWGKIPAAIARIRAARAAGQEVAADIYPYINNGLGIAALIHPRHFAQGRQRLIGSLDDPKVRAQIRQEMETEPGWENWYRHCGSDWNRVIIGSVGDARYAKLAGQSVAQMAEQLGEDPWETFFNLVKGDAFALPQTMTDANKLLLIEQDFISFCTDVGPIGGSRIASHPRAAGSFPRLLGRYVRDLGATSLEQAVSQASALACNEVMAYDRGRIAIGQAADVIVFDDEELTDHATFTEPNALSEGMKYVLVNGVVVLDDGQMTRARPGRVLRGPGYRPEWAPARVSTGKLAPSLRSLDRRIRQHLRLHRSPGVAVAITDQSRLVFARGYGYADVATRTPVTPESLFRIASISKPITAAAILQLVDQQKLALDDRVFDIVKEEPFLAEDAQYDARLDDVTIRQLLQHRGGWDRDVSYDAMFRAVEFAEALGATPPAGPTEVIRYMLGQPLDFDPGQRYAYSNYGYCLLGRVIERVSAEPYEAYVRAHVLAPLGIQRMRLGRTRLEQRQPDEVRYYDPARGKSVFAEDLGETVAHPYGAWHLEAMDSHGGWLASAVDLARFACAFDDPDACPILKPSSVREIVSRPEGRAGYDEEGQPRSTYYGLGWAVSVQGSDALQMAHSGSLPGTSTKLIRRPDGRNVVILFNTRVSPLANRMSAALEAELMPVIDAIEEWPEQDLFEKFQ